jgi:hypothetical protein
MGTNGTRTGATDTTQVAIILDRSGSMEACREATISGYNEYLQTLETMATGDTVNLAVTLTVFNNLVEIADVGATLAQLRPLTLETYIPHGGTAMLDAVGQTLALLEEKAKQEPATSFLVCVISDGQENSSTTYSYEHIAERIQTLTATGRWTFTYLGSNQDLAMVAAQTGIPRGNMRSYDATDRGTQSAWREQSTASLRNVRRRREGLADEGEFYSAVELNLPEREDDPHA